MTTLGRYEGFHGQPGVSTVVQCTPVSVPPEPPRDHIIWSLCCLFYANPCCLGLAALIFSIKARDRKVVGDMEGARHYGSTARCLNTCATVWVSIMILIFIITFTTVTVLAKQAAQTGTGIEMQNINNN
ncbi:dispanin subfamily A member 2b-like [Pseudochaenichthys georgianus]|uniref:dispanin subfamily A member 2b-like n=1 Tax=Pseudochaenichthys georgianus TaxID=52239 RepID=UPI00146BA78A|nr:dispanin subfamily A member 2b-like isoform X2 [Pseudochaenichthys georgianus]